jgi:Zn-dependent protease with chaperone function
VKTFFEHQQLARRNSKVMVVLFLLAVIAVVLAVDLVLAILYLWNADFYSPAGGKPSFAAMLGTVPGYVYFLGALATAAVILAVSLINTLRLAEGGSAVAKMIGARRVAPDTAEPLERRLRNVVEEMAIASGVRVPEVYVMDGERGINAFAAGWDSSSAVVAVTRGTLEALTRDELQGVVAHEFSHILNGDMRLNIRMIGVLAGIVFIGSIGEFVMRSTRGSRDGKGGIFLAGLAIFIIGYVGLFFARLIKSAVSRQR